MGRRLVSRPAVAEGVSSIYPRSFDYVRAGDLGEAVGLLAREPDAKLLAGGQSLVPLLKLRLAAPSLVVDIGRLPLTHVAETPDAVRVGALARHVQMDDSSVIAERFPLITDAVRHIADLQVRNAGTVGGALAEADPCGDWAPVLMALHARVRCIGPGGDRWLPVRDLTVGPYETALAHDEVLAEVEIPCAPEGSAGCYLKVERRAGGFALASAAVQLLMDGGVCRRAAVVMGGVGLTALVAAEAERLLQDEVLTPAVCDASADAAAAASEPLDDVRGSAEYKRALVRVLVRRALAIAERRSRGEEVEARVL